MIAVAGRVLGAACGDRVRGAATIAGDQGREDGIDHSAQRRRSPASRASSSVTDPLVDLELGDQLGEIAGVLVDIELGTTSHIAFVRTVLLVLSAAVRPAVTIAAVARGQGRDAES